MILSYDIEKFDAFSVGQRIQEKRIEKKIKAIDMANALEISKDQYSRIENGRSICSTEKLFQISQYLNVSSDYLLYGKEQKDLLSQINLILEIAMILGCCGIVFWMMNDFTQTGILPLLLGNTAGNLILAYCILMIFYYRNRRGLENDICDIRKAESCVGRCGLEWNL